MKGVYDGKINFPCIELHCVAYPVFSPFFVFKFGVLIECIRPPCVVLFDEGARFDAVGCAGDRASRQENLAFGAWDTVRTADAKFRRDTELGTRPWRWR